MNRRRLGFIVLGIVVLSVVAVSAATLNTTNQAPGGDSAGSDQQGQVSGEPSLSFTGLFGWALYGFFLLVGVVTALMMLRYPLSTIKQSSLTLTSGAIATLIFGTLIYLLMTGSSPTSQADPPRGGQPGNASSGGGGGGSGQQVGEAAGSIFQSPMLLGLLVFGVVAVGVAAAIFLGEEYSSGTRELEAIDVDEDPLVAIGEVAGEAADRLEGDAAVDNEVYRAWNRMTELLADEERDDTLTPREFRRLAIERGMQPGDVDLLTDLFEQVRYGDVPATEDRERQAADALRDIEDTYGREE